MALCGAAGIWTAFWVVAGRCGQTPNDAAGVRTHIENNVFEFERHGATRRGAALRIRCATPFSLVFPLMVTLAYVPLKPTLIDNEWNPSAVMNRD